MTRVLVAVPAHDEEAELPDCLHSVAAAAHLALAQRRVAEVTVAVAAHRCRDRTRQVAEDTLSAYPWLRRAVVADEAARTVGGVRHSLLEHAIGPTPTRGEARRTWIFNTDADSRVPVGWICDTLQSLHRHDAVAAAGMVTLRGWDAPARSHRAYAELLASGIGAHGHTHVYGANLVTRLDVYRAVGGFRAVPHGEDQDLVDRLRARGAAVLTLFAPLVSTSARTPGRAEHGLGALLARLTADAEVEVEVEVEVEAG